MDDETCFGGMAVPDKDTVWMHAVLVQEAVDVLEDASREVPDEAGQVLRSQRFGCVPDLEPGKLERRQMVGNHRSNSGVREQLKHVFFLGLKSILVGRNCLQTIFYESEEGNDRLDKRLVNATEEQNAISLNLPKRCQLEDFGLNARSPTLFPSLLSCFNNSPHG